MSQSAGSRWESHRALVARATSMVIVLCSAACVPEGPPTDGKPRRAAAASRPARTKASSRPSGSSKPSQPLFAPFEDAFDRQALGPNWHALSSVWRIVDGQLCVRGARNKGIWLRRTLPTRARIEFDARSESTDGDLKAELWGDGQSGATKASYSNASSYLAILGGWQNTKHVLARLDEHGDDRLFLDVDPASPDNRARPVEPGQSYRFRVERADDRTVKWSVDGTLYFELDDPEPLTGPGHDHFGFNNWTAPVCFDNVSITPL